MAYLLPSSRVFSASSLEPPETTPQRPPALTGAGLSDAPDLAETFRHSGWRHNRELVYDALKRTVQSVSRIMAFTSCGHRAYVYRSLEPPYHYRLAGSSCRDRFCVPCAKDRSRCLATNVLQALNGSPSRFVTLTLKQVDRPLTDSLDHLYDSFRRLRQRTFWKGHVTGGCGFLEVKHSPSLGTWNVHLHAIVHGRYLPQQTLSAEWLKVTGDSMITDVRFVKDEGKVGRYVTKYVSKPLNSTFLNRSSLLDEVILATRNRRLALTFGDWRGMPLTATPDTGEWVCLGSFDEIVYSALRGDADASEALRQICDHRADAVLEQARTARPPPRAHAPPSAQLAFAWSRADIRFLEQPD